MTLRAASVALAWGVLAAGGLASGALAGAALAQTSLPQPGPGDPRIREILYDPNQVVEIAGRLGYEMAVEFDAGERIENVSIGDSLGWQVTPNRKATLLFLKPMGANEPTSMTVVTSKRIYSFLLTVREGARAGDPMLRLRFLYPPEPLPPPVTDVVEAPPQPPPEPPTLSHAYSWSGSARLAPLRVHDDGTSTFFEFDEARDVPAVYVVGVEGAEELANTRIAGKYLVVDRLAPAFVLRYGKTRTTVHNEGWATTDTSGASRLPRRGKGS